MRRKIISLTVFILLGFILVWAWLHQATVAIQAEPAVAVIKQEPAVNSEIQQTRIKSEQEAVKPEAAAESLSEMLPENWQEDWLQQLANRRYSEDTAVELISIGMEFESCGNNSLAWRFVNMKLTAKQTEIKAGIETHCKILSTQYPLLNSFQVRNGLQAVFDEFPVSTPLGQFLRDQTNEDNDFDATAFATELIPLSLKEKNAQLIFMVNWMLSFFDKIQIYDSALTGGQHRAYLTTIQSIALTALSCEFQDGITCSATSRFMQDKCFDDEQFCNLDFNQWYQQAVTTGMDADIKLVKQYFQQQAQ